MNYKSTLSATQYVNMQVLIEVENVISDSIKQKI